MNMTDEEMAEKAGEDRSGVAIAVSVSLMSLSAVMVGLRLWCRRERQMLGLDDVTVVVGLVSRAKMPRDKEVLMLFIVGLRVGMWIVNHCQYVTLVCVDNIN
jgi:hypothetical protein